MDGTAIESLKIAPYSPEWWELRRGNCTGSNAWKIMTEPRGKSPLQKFEDHALKLAQLEAKYSQVPIGKMDLKTNIALKARIDKALIEYKTLNEKKNDYHFSDTAESYILELVHEKMSGLTKTGIDNFATQWGVEHEPLAKQVYSRYTGNELLGAYMEVHPTIEGFSCTPDDLTGEDTVVEFKCPANGANHLKHWLISNDEYMKEKHPDHYWQCYSQMNILRRTKADFVSFDPRLDKKTGLFIYSMEYDTAEGETLEARMKLARNLFNDYYKLFAGQK